MILKFDKYQGAGNDFIILNNFDGLFSKLSVHQFREMCDRHNGIGADGIILLKPANNADFEMEYYNSDGKLSSLCGNGARCAVLYAYKNKTIGRYIARAVVGENPFNSKNCSSLKALNNSILSASICSDIRPAKFSRRS